MYSPLKLLSLALRTNTSDLSFLNITTARITDTSLLLAIAIYKKVINAKLIDYALILDRPTWEAGSKRQCVSLETDNINHIASAYIRYTPIAISIETKRGQIGGDEANLQLALIVHAYFAKLEQLTSLIQSSSIPALPLIKMLGHE